MINGPIPALRALPTGILGALARALRSGHLPREASTFMIRYLVPDASEFAAAELLSLLVAGLSPDHAALVLEVVAAERISEAPRAEIELVTSGPATSGGTRDTGVVLRELFSQAEYRVLILGFAVHQSHEIFAALADRVCQRPDLAVRLCFDIHRAPGDTTISAALLRRFAQRFIQNERPGPRLPQMFYDPRSLIEGETGRANLHAKCVVADGTRAFIGSANFTEAAQLRNIEIGLLVTDAAIASAAERHIDGLISAGHLWPLAL